LLARADLDNNAELRRFCETLEGVIVETVESGKYTKDLAICVKGTMNVPRESYLNTTEFIDYVADQLVKKMKQ